MAATAAVAPKRRAAPMTGPALRFKALDSLKAYEKNARTHSAEQIAQIKRSMLEFGWTVPVLEDAQGVVAGHGRMLAARELYAEGAVLAFPDGTAIPAGTVPVLACDGWSDEKRRAYIIVDNKLSLNAGWDDALLASEIQDLLGKGIDAESFGFDEADMTFYSGGGADFKPGEASGQSKLDQTAPIKCPSCGHEFHRT